MPRPLAPQAPPLQQRLRCLPLGALLLLLMPGCGGQGEPAPRVVVKAATCTTLDTTLASTLTAIESDALKPLSGLVADIGERQLFGSVMRALLFLIRELAPGYINASSLMSVHGFVADIEPTVERALEPFATAAQVGDTDTLLVFDAAAGFINSCPDDALLSAIQVFTDDPALLDALINLLSSPKLNEAVETATGALGSDSGRAGFVALVDVIAVALRSPNFDLDGLIALVATFLPTDETPFVELIDAVKPVLTEDNLATLATAIDCVEAEARTLSTGRPVDGVDLVAEALYRLLVVLGDDLGDLVAQLSAFVDGPSGDPVLAFVRDLVASLEADDELRREALTVATFLLKVDHVDGLILGLDALLKAGSLVELVDMLGILADDVCADGAVEALRVMLP